MVWLGCFLSSSKGYEWMGKTALRIGADTFQFFTRNPRGGSVKPMDTEDAAKLAKMQSEGLLGPVIAHAPYTINPCGKEHRIREFAYETMKEDLRRLEYLPGNYYNLHPGSHVGQGEDAGIRMIAETLNSVLFPGMKTTVLLETMAGKGSELGGTFEQLKRVMDQVELRAHIGVCLDTCHVHDGGYDLTEHLDWVLEEFDRIIGLESLKALHLNDSMNPCGARKDRHQKLGQGYLGEQTMKRIVNHPLLQNRPMVLETPNELDGYENEIRLLRRMIDEPMHL